MSDLLFDVSEKYAPGLELSFTKLNIYQQCPFKYKLTYVDRWFKKQTPQMAFGHTIHRALEDFHKKKAVTYEELYDSYVSVWVNEGFTTPLEALEYFDKGEKLLKDFFSANAKSLSEVVFVEKAFRFNIGKEAVRGIIDRIDKHSDGTYEVIDYKTHKELWDKSRIDSDLQLSLYAIACEKSLGFVAGRLSLYFLTHNVKISTERTEKQLKDAEEQVISTARGIRAEEFTPKTENCFRCDFKNRCQYSEFVEKKEG